MTTSMAKIRIIIITVNQKGSETISSIISSALVGGQSSGQF